MFRKSGNRFSEENMRKLKEAESASRVGMRSNDGFEMNERAEHRLPRLVPWIGLVVAALTVVIFFASGPTSHTRHALCMAFASIYTDNCRVSP